MTWSMIQMHHRNPAPSMPDPFLFFPSSQAQTRGSGTCFLQWTAPLRLLDRRRIPNERMKLELHCFDYHLGHIKIAQATWLHLPQHPSPTCSTTERCCHLLISECFPFNFGGNLSSKRLQLQLCSLDHRLCHI